ncbi:hypothetical protein U9M48_016727 [Paspalum notatum var. saurae]|uniref:Uncharacterized protein n=1 Tax=Paspalum notatum var. saurae TaxID=547442 RepID=A0AAQ3T775_PASNO
MTQRTGDGSATYCIAFLPKRKGIRTKKKKTNSLIASVPTRGHKKATERRREKPTGLSCPTPPPFHLAASRTHPHQFVNSRSPLHLQRLAPHASLVPRAAPRSLKGHGTAGAAAAASSATGIARSVPATPATSEITI